MKPVGITMGDPAGIGPEIVVKAHLENPTKSSFIVYGDPDVLSASARQLGATVEVSPIERPTEARVGRLNVVPVTSSALPEIGRVSAEAGRASADYVEHATRDALAGELAAVVTAPINKEALKAAGVPFPGHTEMLQHLTSAPAVAMMLATPHLRVVLATIHVSLRDAIELLDQRRIEEAIGWADRGAKILGVTRPRIAVAGLNPHAGENGLFGTEESRIIAPAVQAARRRGLDVSGPHPPDTVFMQARAGSFDIVVALYHDQGLIPIKYLGIHEGVNITLGLPFLRVSVDHGTAFDIAGTGRADHASLMRCLEIANAGSNQQR